MYANETTAASSDEVHTGEANEKLE
ncbi:hypothetical protein A1C_00590 [Rickettsia akari str. Hartford]|uniref:Uncharacterized protein n=1 Tax=Rickettsia akari (strain Hartford) TaxID=293614 RepID=A8GM26_RICAH|nr:hypothetical protein A1C_00590 [Rickettsia akari str. Hartford]